MKKCILVAMLLCLTAIARAQDDDNVLMVIAGRMITLPDFQQSYQQNQTLADYSKDQVNDYLKHFINLQLQVAEAEALRLDTLREFREQMAGLAYALEGTATSAENETAYDRYRGKPCVQVVHLFLPLKQHASYGEQQVLRARIDSVYEAVRAGADFMQLASNVSQGHACVEWLGRNEALEDVETAVFRLAEGELSVPVFSTDGFHLMKCLKVGMGESLNADGIAPMVGKSSGNQYDYRKGLLVHFLYEKEMRGKAQADMIGLQDYFQENRKKYEWDIPHYKGLVYQSKDKKTRKAVKKLLSKQPMERWESIISDPAYQHVFQNVKTTAVQLFKLGQNEYVDELAFGGPKANVDADYPLCDILGKDLKKYPDSLEDVKLQVLSDYQEYLDNQWLATLRKHHEVAVNERALKKLYK